MFDNKSREEEKQFLKRLSELPGLIKLMQELSNKADGVVDKTVVQDLKNEYIDKLEVFGHLNGENARILKERYLDKKTVDEVFEKQYLAEATMYHRIYRALDSLKEEMNRINEKKRQTN